MVYALIAGLLSFFSPCIFPLIPVYIGMLGSNAQDKYATWWFCLGLTIVFVLLGMTATSFGILLHQHSYLMRVIGGVLMILFGLHALKILDITLLNRTLQFPVSEVYRFQPFVMGATFACAWSPCVGPMLGSILMIAANAATVWYGGFLLFIYSLGLSIPFLLASLFLHRLPFLDKWIKSNLETVEFISGWFLILFGIAMIIGIAVI